MIQIRRYLTRLSFTDILAAVSIVISLIVLVRDYYQSARIDQLSYTTSAVQFRPNLKIVGNLRIVDFALGTRLPHLDGPSLEEILTTPAELEIHISLRCTNTGNSLARIVNTFWTDTVSGEEKLRALLTDKVRRQDAIIPASFNDYYKTRDLSSGDTTDIEARHMVASYHDETFTLHFLILYENETGALFDTYYWARFAAGPFKMQEKDILIDGKREIIVTLGCRVDSQVVRLIDSHSSTMLYSPEAAKDILRFISSIPRKDGGG